MISLIAAIGKNNELGKDNKLLFNLPEDLKFFKETTMGHPVIMGRKTYESIGRLLPKRENIILSNSFLDIPGATIFHTVDDVLSYAKNKDVFVIGGGSIYKMFIDYADRLYLTLVDKDASADVFFPEFDKSLFEEEILCEHNENDIKYKHVLYRRK